MSSSKIAFIVNPNAGNGSTGTKWPFIKTLAENRLGSFKTYITARPGDATVFAKDAVAKGLSLIVCVGGDGTLNEVVNGLMEYEKSDLTIGVIPIGTGCNFVRTVAIPKNINEAIDIIATRNVRSIDLGRLVFRGHNGSKCRWRAAGNADGRTAPKDLLMEGRGKSRKFFMNNPGYGKLAHSCRSASMGSRRAAFRAGK